MVQVPKVMVWVGSLYLVGRSAMWGIAFLVPANPSRFYAGLGCFVILLLVGSLRVWKLPKDRPLVWHFIILSAAMLLESWLFEAYSLNVMQQLAESPPTP